MTDDKAGRTGPGFFIFSPMALAPKTHRTLFVILNLILAYNLSCLIIYSLNFIIKLIFHIDAIGSRAIPIIIVGSLLFIGSLYPCYKITRRFLLALASKNKNSN